VVWGLGGRNARQVDGCRESEVSREWGSRVGTIAPMIHGSVQVERDVSKPCEWLIGDTIFWLRNGFNALTEPRPGGCNGGAQRAPLPRCVVVQHTSCVRSNGADFAVLQWDCCTASCCDDVALHQLSPSLAMLARRGSTFSRRSSTRTGSPRSYSSGMFSAMILLSAGRCLYFFLILSR